MQRTSPARMGLAADLGVLRAGTAASWPKARGYRLPATDLRHRIVATETSHGVWLGASSSGVARRLHPSATYGRRRATWHGYETPPTGSGFVARTGPHFGRQDRGMWRGDAVEQADAADGASRRPRGVRRHGSRASRARYRSHRRRS